jgi:hypothetical protein
MSQTEAKEETVQAGWRFYVGVGFFALSLVLPLFIPLLNATNLPVQWKTVVSGLLIVGIPQLFSLGAIAVLGKNGFNYIRSKLFSFIKRYGPPKEVSSTRYRIGLVLFLIPILFGWLAPYVPEYIPGYVEHRILVNAVGDFIFLTSFLVLGGEFWEKIRALFIYEAKAQTIHA